MARQNFNMSFLPVVDQKSPRAGHTSAQLSKSQAKLSLEPGGKHAELQKLSAVSSPMLARSNSKEQRKGHANESSGSSQVGASAARALTPDTRQKGGKSTQLRVGGDSTPPRRLPGMAGARSVSGLGDNRPEHIARSQRIDANRTTDNITSKTPKLNVDYGAKSAISLTQPSPIHNSKGGAAGVSKKFKRERIISLWHKTFWGVKQLMKASSLFASVLRRSHEELLLRQQGTRDSSAMMVRDVLAKAKGSRSEADMELLDSIITLLSSEMAQLSPGQRARLYELMTYEFHPKNIFLTREKATAESVYILISGQVTSYALKNGKKKKVLILEVGSVIGAVEPEDFMKKETILREYNVECLVNCDFVRVRIGDYIRAVFGHDGSAIDNLVGKLNSIPFFSNQREDVLLSAAQCCKMIPLAPSEEVFSEDMPCDRIFFICQGSCIVQKTIRLIRRSNKLDRPEHRSSDISSAMSKKIVRGGCTAWTPGMRAGVQDEIFNQKVTITELHKGQWFPPLQLLPDVPLISNCDAPYLPRDENTGQPLTDSQLKAKLRLKPSHNSYIASHPKCTWLACFSITDFLRFASHNLVAQVSRPNELLKVPIPILQMAYLESTGLRSSEEDGVTLAENATFLDILRSVMKRHQNLLGSTPTLNVGGQPPLESPSNEQNEPSDKIEEAAPIEASKEPEVPTLGTSGSKNTSKPQEVAYVVLRGNLS